MKDKYDNVKLIDIDAKQLLKEVRDEVEIVLLHLDILQAIASSDCSVMELNKAFKKVNDASDILEDLASCYGTYGKLNNRFQVSITMKGGDINEEV